MGSANENPQTEYRMSACAGSDLSSVQLADCLRIISEGSAVNVASAKKELPLAPIVVIITKADQIVGVGAIKQLRPKYAASVAKKSGHEFDKTMSELGYVAVEKHNRGQHLSSKMVDELLSKSKGQLFATTDSERMRSSLRRTGFKKEGGEWKGKRGQLSLWIRNTDSSE